MTTDIQGWIYFAHAPKANRVKIRHTSRLKTRLSALQTDCPEPLELIGAFAGDKSDEAAVHANFHDLRTHGEWFNRHRDLMLWIEERNELPEPENCISEIADWLQVGPKTVIRWIESGELHARQPTRHIGTWRIPKSAIQAFMYGRQAKPKRRRKAKN